MKTNGHAILALFMTLGVAAGLAPAQAQPVSAESESQYVLAAALYDAAMQDDTLYQKARQALNEGQYRAAVKLFESYLEEEPDSKYAADAMYYQAFALSRMRATSDLHQALAILDYQRASYPDAATAGDAYSLATRIQGELAKRGDARSAAEIERRVAEIEREHVREVEREVSREQVEVARMQREIAHEQAAVAEHEARSHQEVQRHEEKMFALQALMNMNPESALPILKKVISSKDPEDAELRAQAMFLLAQYDSDEVLDIMVDVARTDPDEDVRAQAVFWLSQVDSEQAVDALQEILSNPADSALHGQAVFALSQTSDDERVGDILRSYAMSESASEEIRNQAIFWLAQQPSEENADFLRELFARTDDVEAKNQILFALSQMEGQANGDWLMSVAMDESEDIETRNQALFAAIQSDEVPAESIVQLYDQSPDTEMRGQLIWLLTQIDDPVAADKLFDIARNETDPELRQNAVFWVGQSDDPRAEQILLEILEQ